MKPSQNLLILTRYDRLGASSRIRFFAYEKFLREEGFTFEFQSLLSDQYLKQLYSNGKRSYLTLLILYIRRCFFLLFNSSKFDLVWIEKELFPGLPTGIELYFMKRMKRVILDYDDAVHLNYKNKKWGRENKLEKLMAQAQCVFSGSPFLEKVALQAGQKNVVRVPTPVEVGPYQEIIKQNPLRVGWIGSSASEKYLLVLYPLIEKLKERPEFEFYFMGTSDISWLILSNVKVLPWSEDSEKKLLEKLDVGLMPLNHGPWEEGKCSYKILLYSAHGVPAIASTVGMNTEVITHGFNGLLVEDQWLEALDLFSKMSQDDFGQYSIHAYKRVRSHYSYSVVYDIIKKNFLTLLKRPQ